LCRCCLLLYDTLFVPQRYGIYR